MKRNKQIVDAEDEQFSEEEKYTKRSIDLEFNIKKPGDHAKVIYFKLFEILKKNLLIFLKNFKRLANGENGK